MVEIYNSFINSPGNGWNIDWVEDDIFAALLNPSYSFNIEDETFDDINLFQIASINYLDGGVEVLNRAGTSVLRCSDITFPKINCWAKYMLLYKKDGVDKAQWPLLACVHLDYEGACADSILTVRFRDGVIRV
jgi:hypothetical protein